MMSTNSPFGAQEENAIAGRELEEEAKMLLLGKRPRPSPSSMLRRTSSMGGGIVVTVLQEAAAAVADDDIIIEDDPPPPPQQQHVIIKDPYYGIPTMEPPHHKAVVLAHPFDVTGPKGLQHDDHHDHCLGIIPLSPSYSSPHVVVMPTTTAPHFLRTCALCKRPLPPAGRDIYMYRGDTAFCSLECREKQIRQDERKEKQKVPVVAPNKQVLQFTAGAPPTNAPSQGPTNTKSIAAAST